MLHIATVHYKSPRWIPIQTRYLKQFVGVPFQTWTSLEGIDRDYGAPYFDHVIEQKGEHAEKLNHLALEIAHVASPEDQLIFLDGDAFPIAPLTDLLQHGLEREPLVAIRRAENAGDLQPHPSFCLTTVGFWRELPGDWSRGYTWVNDAGSPASDVGANLLRALELSGVSWGELRRSRLPDLHPLWFGVYGDVVYHHGAGFRDEWKFSRLDLTMKPKPLKVGPVPGISHLMRRLDAKRWRRWREATEARNREESERIFSLIAEDGPRWLASLDSTRPSGQLTG